MKSEKERKKEKNEKKKKRIMINSSSLLDVCFLIAVFLGLWELCLRFSSCVKVVFFLFFATLCVLSSMWILASMVMF